MSHPRIIGFLKGFLLLIYIVFFASMFFSVRALSSISAGAVCFFGLGLNVFEGKPIIRKKMPNLFVSACVIFFVLQAIELFYTHNLQAGINHVQVKTAMVIIPVALYYANYLNSSFKEKIMSWYVFMLVLMLTICLLSALLRYSTSHDYSVFFYHDLVRPFHQHAVYVSILVFVAFVYLLEKVRSHHYLFGKFVHFAAIAFFMGLIFLLASKLVISFSCICLFVYCILYARHKRFGRWALLMAACGFSFLLALVLTTKNPVSKRFGDILNGEIAVITQNKFKPGDYFNGVQFRALQWRFAVEILSEQKAWLMGVSPGDAQTLLDEKYNSMNMYTGGPGTDKRGFLGFDTHNEFLESLLQTGILGGLIFLAICAGFIQMMIKSKQLELWFVGLLLLAYALVESVLETQYGLFIFLFFPLFLYFTKDGNQSDATI